LLDHRRLLEVTDRALGLVRAGDHVKATAGDPVARRETFHEGLGTLELRGHPGRTEDDMAGSGQAVRQAITQRNLGTNHHQVWLLTGGNVERLTDDGSQHFAGKSRVRRTRVAR